MTWTITPFAAVGPIEFGMSFSEVAAILGTPIKTRMHQQSVCETRKPGLPTLYYRQGGVVEIEASPVMEDVMLGDIRLFAGAGIDVLRRIEQLDGTALSAANGLVVSRRLGLAMTCQLELDRGIGSVVAASAFREGFMPPLNNFAPTPFPRKWR